MPRPTGGESFPEGFVWGAATASAQIEGAASLDGKSPSVWDTFAATPGRVQDGDTPETACDHYHRYASDADLLRSLGLSHYRLSIAWPRIVPDGDGPVNVPGLDFYDRLVDALLARGITPWITLFHWDLPQRLEDRGGWPVRATAEAFRPYCEAVVRRLADRVQHWFTVNEIPCFIGHGYGTGAFAPGRRETPAVVNQAYHHALLAHGQAVAAVREHGGPSARVGLVHNHLPAPPIPVSETETHIAAARVHYRRTNRQLMAPVFQGRYDEDFLREAGAAAPRIERGDLSLIGQPTDYLGLNLYWGDFVRADARGAPEVVVFPAQYPKGDMPWLHLTPQVMEWAVRLARDEYQVPPIYITENGAAFADTVQPDGRIDDLDRREFLRSYLSSLHRVIRAGYDVRGFFAWSLLDNFEWAEGYARRFGLVHVDYATQRRTPKLSAHWYRDVIRTNRLV